MGNVFRCYVEKKPGFAVEAEHLFGELRHTLGLTGLTGVRVLRRYDVEGVDAAVYAAARTTVLSEPQVDALWDEVMPAPEGEHTLLAVEALPGQYDQRADSCAQCIQMMHGGERPTVRAATVYVLEGALTTPEAAKARGYLINPVESREAALDKPATLRQDYPVPAAVPVLEGFTALDRAGLEGVLAQYALAMDLADLAFLQAYFRDEEGRDPTLTEVRVVDTYWSDHCRHTTFSTHLDAVEIADDNVKAAYERYLSARVEVYGAEKAAKRPQTLMDIATLGAKTLKKRGLLPELDESEEINACSIHVPAQVDGKEQDWLLMFKNETHNHPTEIEPFGGAATCIGGCIRDPLSGRVYVHQAMRLTGCGDPRTPVEQTLEGKLPQRKIAQTAAAGYSSYGNQIGLATGHVAELYHEGYVAKHLECGAVVGAAPASNVRRERPAPGDVVILLGGRTGRDGIGGATGSSKSHNKASLDTMASEVQKGNAPEERKLQRLFRAPAVTEAVRDLLQNRDGLMLGICNGFQALVKLGLVPFGDIRPMDEDCPTLTFNNIGRHQSRLVRTRVASNLSPWLSRCEVGDVHTVPISHGEGRFVASEDLLVQLRDAGQIATQYVGADGRPSMDLDVNPNGSAWAIEGITSPDGRVFGKMGHSERRGAGLYQNVPGDLFQPLFEGGVGYFTD